MGGLGKGRVRAVIERVGVNQLGEMLEICMKTGISRF